MSVAEPDVGQKPGYIFELSADLGCNRNLSVRGNFPVGETLENMNSEMDKLIRVCDRQLSKAVIPAIEKKIRDEQRTLENFKANVQLIRAQQSGHTKLPAQAQANLDNAEANVRAQEANIEEQKQLLERTKQDAQ